MKYEVRIKSEELRVLKYEVWSMKYEVRIKSEELRVKN
jgi:hypothetical protein